MSNGLRMPFAEWLHKMSAAKLSPAKRVVAVYAAAFDITGNSELEFLTGLSARTLDGLKQDLPKEGWIVIPPIRGGRGHGIKVYPAFQETPVTFTDLSPKNPRRFNPRNADNPPQELPPYSAQTPAEITPVIEETPAISAPVSKKVSPTPPSKNLLLTTVEQEVSSNPTTSLSPLEAARECGEDIGFGVWVNGKTIRHPAFQISLAGIQMQLCGAVPMETIRSVAAGHALQWATDLASGKPLHQVVPSNTANFIRASIQRQANDAAVTDVRKERAAKGHGGGKTGSNRMSLDELSAAVDATFDHQKPQQSPTKPRITHER